MSGSRLTPRASIHAATSRCRRTIDEVDSSGVRSSTEAEPACAGTKPESSTIIRNPAPAICAHSLCGNCCGTGGHRRGAESGGVHEQSRSGRVGPLAPDRPDPGHRGWVTRERRAQSLMSMGRHLSRPARVVTHLAPCGVSLMWRMTSPRLTLGCRRVRCCPDVVSCQGGTELQDV